LALSSSGKQMYSQSRSSPREYRRLPLILLFLVAAAGELFVLFVVFLKEKPVHSPELPASALKWILPFIHLLPLIAGRTAIKEYLSRFDPDSARAGLAIWQMFKTYIAMGVLEIGLTMLLGR